LGHPVGLYSIALSDKAVDLTLN